MKDATRAPNEPIENLAVGTIIEVNGSRIVAELDPNLLELSRVYAGDAYSIGQFGSIAKVHFGRRIIYAFVGRLRMKAEYELERGIPSRAAPDERVLEAELFGEGEWVQEATASTPQWRLKFERGVSTYPLPQQTLYLTPQSELRFIYGRGEGPVIRLGEHVGAGGTPCYAELNELLGKHTAVLGATGAGKSGTVAVILHALVGRGTECSYSTWKPSIVILDPHNEYRGAFPGHRPLSTDAGTLSLPFWLLNLQETISLVIGKTEFVATSQANIVKNALAKARIAAASILRIDGGRITVDSPVPYDLEQFKHEVEAQRPSGQNKQQQEPFDSVINKLETLRRDARMRFMMTNWSSGGDEFAKILMQFTGEGPAVRIVDLSGVPNEVAGIASAAIARTLFSLKVWQSIEERKMDPILLVCEEAHRYTPNRGEAQYEAAQEAIRRIAKEGRKYGIGLMLVSQRPSEVEATVLSQCNSWIVHRVTNDADRDHVRSILPDSVSGLSKMLSGLRRREAIFVGQAAMLPSRILVDSLPEERLPQSHDINFDTGWKNEPMAAPQLNEVARRWRYQER